MKFLMLIYLLYLFGIGVYGAVKYKSLTAPFKLLLLFIAYTFFSDISGRIGYYLGVGSTYPLYHINSWVFISVNALIYLKLFPTNRSLKKSILLISIGCFLIAFLNTLLHQDFNTFPNFSIAAHAFQSIFLSLLIFKEMLKKPTETKLIQQAVFWFVLGTLIFYSLNFMGFVFYNEFNNYSINSKWFYFLNWGGNMFLASCYLIALYLNQKQQYE